MGKQNEEQGRRSELLTILESPQFNQLPRRAKQSGVTPLLPASIAYFVAGLGGKKGQEPSISLKP